MALVLCVGLWKILYGHVRCHSFLRQSLVRMQAVGTMDTYLLAAAGDVSCVSEAVG